jgi:steroid delta-isomerase-like uncharacterized protein
MTIQDNVMTSRRFFEQVCTAGNLDTIDDLVTADAIHRDRDAEEYHGPEGVREWITGYRSAFPDLRVIVEEQVAQGDTVVTRWTTEGTHRGELWGIPPTGRPFVITGITIDRFVEDRIAESKESWDALGMLQQLGILPEGVRAPS